MHRTQVIIDDKHYAFLKEKAKQEKKSISQVLREIIESYSRKSDVYSLLSVSGIAEDAECYGKDHDKWLYGKK
jgi:predicted CopG family antitoxin